MRLLGPDDDASLSTRSDTRPARTGGASTGAAVTVSILVFAGVGVGTYFLAYVIAHIVILIAAVAAGGVAARTVYLSMRGTHPKE